MRSEMMGLGESIQCVMRAEYLRGCADERAKCIAEIEALLDGFGENEITDGYEHGFNEGLARALDALREKED